MTGVSAGSGSSGVREGSRPGSGVEDVSAYDIAVNATGAMWFSALGALRTPIWPASATVRSSDLGAESQQGRLWFAAWWNESGFAPATYATTISGFQTGAMWFSPADRLVPPPSFVGVSSGAWWNNESATKTVTAPAHNVGDLLIVSVVLDMSGGLLFLPSWNPLRDDTTDTPLSMKQLLYTRIADGTSADNASVIVPNAAAFGQAVMAVYRNAVVALTAVVRVSTDQSGVTVGPSLIAIPEGRIGLSIATRVNGAGSPWLAPSKGTERYNAAGDWGVIQIVEYPDGGNGQLGLVGHDFAGLSRRIVHGVALR